MRTAFVSLALVAASAASFANCVGSQTLYTCTDASGNTYTVNKLGATTTVTGSNAATGAQWNQQSNQVGNTTFVNGQNNGRSWNNTITTTGSTTTQSGVDSHGRPFYKTCNAYGCY
jgi:hypothetical protein